MDVNTHTYIMLLDMKGSMTLPSGCYAQTPIVLDVQNNSIEHLSHSKPAAMECKCENVVIEWNKMQY